MCNPVVNQSTYQRKPVGMNSVNQTEIRDFTLHVVSNIFFKEPTYFSHNGESTIDLVFSNSVNLVNSFEVRPNSLTKHCEVVSVIDLESTVHEKRVVSIRKLNGEKLENCTPVSLLTYMSIILKLFMKSLSRFFT